LVESSIEHFGRSIASAYKPYAALVLAIVLCLGLQLDMVDAIFTEIFHRRFDYPYVGEVVTGLVVSRGSNFVNDVVSRIGVVPRASTTIANVEQETQKEYRAKVYP
jgi:hypothetical protein